jgi:membrane fusion protein, multidrug efflux system
MNRSGLIAIIITVLAVAWMASGLLAPATQTPDASAQGSDEVAVAIPRVRVASFEASKTPRVISLQGRTMADRAVTISAQTDGRLESVEVDRGDTVQEGDLLARIDIEDRQDRVAEAKALLAQRQIEFNAANSLTQRGFQSEVRLSQAKADLESAKAALERAEIELRHVEIKAPISGTVLRRMIEQGSFMDRGDALIELVDLDPIKVVGSVPEAEVNALRLGQPADVVIADIELQHGTITFIAPQAEPDTRTFEIEVQLPNPEGRIRAGLTAELRLPIEGGRSHQFPASILSLDDSGQLGVKAVTDDNHVRFMPVDIVDDGPEGVWVSGLPETVRLITVGQEFVIDGQEVEPVDQPHPAMRSAGTEG